MFWHYIRKCNCGLTFGTAAAAATYYVHVSIETATTWLVLVLVGYNNVTRRTEQSPFYYIFRVQLSFENHLSLHKNRICSYRNLHLTTTIYRADHSLPTAPPYARLRRQRHVWSDVILPRWRHTKTTAAYAVRAVLRGLLDRPRGWRHLHGRQRRSRPPASPTEHIQGHAHEIRSAGFVFSTLVAISGDVGDHGSTHNSVICSC